MVIQFEKAGEIQQIDIGNEGSAFVEVLVARGNDDFQVLVKRIEHISLNIFENLSKDSSGLSVWSNPITVLPFIWIISRTTIRGR